MTGDAGLSPGKVVGQGRYRLEKKLGQGGFGEVWKAWDDKRGEPVALKTILPTLGADRSVAARFRREIATAARLTHPNIVRILDTGQFEDGRPFFSMEFLDGQPLERFTNRLSSSLLLFDQLLEALAFAHARGIIHRDLKPDNVIVMVSEGQLHLKLLDFGIALLDEGLGAGQGQVSITRPGLPVGTVPYMSPEQASGEPSSAGPASDLYSVGVMLYELLSGERPFEGDWMFVIVQHVSLAPKPLIIKPDFQLEDPRPLIELVGTLLKKPYRERPECAAHVRQMLAQIRESLRDSADSLLTDLPAIEAADGTYLPTMASTGGSLVSGEEVDQGALSLLRMHEAPVVGREAEQKALWEAVARVTSSRRPEAVMVSSPPNRGKSRLARWLVEEVHRAGLMRVLNVYVIDGGLPAAMHAAIYRALRLPKLERQPLSRRIDDVLNLEPADRDELCEFLMAGGRIADPVAEAERLKGWARLWQKFIWRLTEFPSKRPLLVWIDGPDQGDMAETSGWIELLLNVTKIGRRPVLLLWTVEPEGEALSPGLEKVSRREDTTLMELSPLSPEAQARLARYYAPDLAEDAIAVLQERSMGNPFFLREMLLSWIDEGALQASERGLSLSIAARAQAPEGLDRIVKQRLVHFLERKPDLDEAAESLLILAYLGQSFPESLAQDALAGSQISTADLIEEGFLEVIPGAREQELTLSSKNLREALLEMAEQRGVVALLLGRGIELRVASGLGAMIRSDWEMAERCLAVGWNLIDDAPSELVNELWRMEILDLLCCMAFRRREAVLLNARAQSIAWVAGSATPEIQKQLKALVGIWDGAALLLEGDFQGAPAEIQIALDLSCLIGDVALEARALHGLGRAAQMAGDRVKALDLLGRSSQAFRKLDRHTRSAQPLLNLFEADVISDQAAVMAEEGDLVAASVQLRMLLGLYKQYNDRQGEAHTLTKLVRIMRKLGDVTQAAALIVEARAIMQIIDDRWGLAVLQWEEATACLKGNDLERADVNYRAAARLFASFKDEVSEASCINARGELARKGGRLREAVEHYLAFRASMARLSHTHGLGLADINLGWTYMVASNPQTAQQHFHAAYETLHGAGPRGVLISAMVGWSWAAALLGDVQGAIATLHNAQGLNEGRPVIDEDTQRALAAISTFAGQCGLPALSEAAGRLPVQG